MQPLLELNGIGKHFGGVHALKDVSLRIHAGEIHCLAGENGSGKSTLIKVMSGVHRPDGGRIVMQGTRLDRLNPIEAVRRGIQVIYQDFSLFPNLTVAENLALNRQLEHRRVFVNWKTVRATARHALKSLGITMDLDARVGALPVAQKQLVAIARALLQDAKLIIMDEPTTALTNIEVNALFAIMQRLRDRGAAILFVSHKLREMLRVSDRFTVLRNGEVVAEGPADEFSESKITLHMTGKSLDVVRGPAPVDAKGQPLLEVRNLSGPMLHDASFELFSGEILGVTGLLGSGQTDLALTLFGAGPECRGTVRIDGRTTTIRSIQGAMNSGIAYVPEDRLSEGLFLERSVAHNMMAANLRPLYGRCGLISPAKVTHHVAAWLKAMAVRVPSDQIPARALSGGNQQRLVLAKWLATEPKILILNGPSVGVDVASKVRIHNKLRELAMSGMGILLISDDLPELAENCNRVLLMHQRRIVQELMGEQCHEDAIADCLNQLT